MFTGKNINPITVSLKIFYGGMFAIYVMPLCPPVDQLRVSRLSDGLPSTSFPYPRPTMLFPKPELTSPWRHAGASSSAPNYTLATSSTEKTSNYYETERNNLGPRENKAAVRLATSGSGKVWMCMTLCFKLIYHRALEILSEAGLETWKWKVFWHSK